MARISALGKLDATLRTSPKKPSPFQDRKQFKLRLENSSSFCPSGDACKPEYAFPLGSNRWLVVSESELAEMLESIRAYEYT
jgi:hypothetical protein